MLGVVEDNERTHARIGALNYFYWNGLTMALFFSSKTEAPEMRMETLEELFHSLESPAVEVMPSVYWGIRFLRKDVVQDAFMKLQCSI